MYRKAKEPPTPPSQFELPVAVKLSQDNRWVIMAALVPWSEFEAEYAENFASDNRVMAKLPHTSQTAIAITFLVMNLSSLLRQGKGIFFGLQTLSTPFLGATINSGYNWGNCQEEKLIISQGLNNYLIHWLSKSDFFSKPYIE